MRSPSHLPCPSRFSSRLAAILVAAILFSIASATPVRAQSANRFRWLSPTADTAPWTKIQAAFKNELQSDVARGDGRTVYAHKFLERVAIVDQSALVIVSHRTAK